MGRILAAGVRNRSSTQRSWTRSRSCPRGWTPEGSRIARPVQPTYPQLSGHQTSSPHPEMVREEGVCGIMALHCRGVQRSSSHQPSNPKWHLWPGGHRQRSSPADHWGDNNLTQGHQRWTPIMGTIDWSQDKDDRMSKVMWVEWRRNFPACFILPKPGHSPHPSATLWFRSGHEVSRTGEVRLDSKSEVGHHILHCSSQQWVNQRVQRRNWWQNSSKIQHKS